MDLGSVYASLGFDAVAALMIAATLFGLRVWYDAPFLGPWGAGWSLMAVRSLGSILALQAVVAGTTVSRGLATGTVIAAALAQAALQLEGARRRGPCGPASRRAGILIASAILGYAVTAVVATSNDWADPIRATVRLAIPYGVLGLAFLSSATIVYRQGVGDRLGHRLLPAAFALFGMQEVLSGLVAADFIELPTVVSTLGNLLAMVLVGLALPLWFLEEEREEVHHSHQRERVLQEQLEEARRLESLGQLAAGVAHDFNNLLTVVGGHAEMIREESPLPSTSVREAVSEILQAQARGARLVGRLLTFARKDANAPTQVDARDVVERLVPLMDPVVGDDIVLAMHQAPRPVEVFIDPGQLERVILNLVLNARDAQPRGGRIVVRTYVVDEGEPPEPGRSWGVVEVQDGGVGIAAEVRPRIFEPFFTTKVRDQGTGLGLSTVHGIVEDAGGHIVVDSKVGVGTTFTLLFPFADADG